MSPSKENSMRSSSKTSASPTTSPSSRTRRKPSNTRNRTIRNTINRLFSRRARANMPSDVRYSLNTIGNSALPYNALANAYKLGYRRVLKPVARVDIAERATEIPTVTGSLPLLNNTPIGEYPSRDNLMFLGFNAHREPVFYDTTTGLYYMEGVPSVGTPSRGGGKKNKTRRRK